MLGIESWGDAGSAAAVIAFIGTIVGLVFRYGMAKPIEDRLDRKIDKIAKIYDGNGGDDDDCGYEDLRRDIKSDIHSEMNSMRSDMQGQINQCRDDLRNEIRDQRKTISQLIRQHVIDFHQGGGQA